MIEVLSQISLWLLVVVGVINLILSIFVYRSNSKSATNKIFLFLGLVITCWLVVMYASLQNFSPSTNLLLIRLSLFWATAINCLFLVLASTIPEEKIQIERKKLIILVSITLGVMLLTLTHFIFSGIVVQNGAFSPLPGKAIFLFPLYIVITSLMIAWVLIKRIANSKGILRKQLFLVLLGITLMLSLIVVTIVIPVAVFQNSFFVQFFPLYTLFFTGLAAYAIVRHRLFNINVIATEAVTVIIWIVLLAKLFVTESRQELIIDLLILLIIVLFGILLIRSVIREVKQREKLQVLTKKLKELDKQKDEFISMAAHELRAPMTAIKGYVSMITQGDAGEITEKARGFLADANSINDRLIRLVNNMLNVSRIEEGRMVFQLETEELSHVTRVVYSQFTPEAERKGLKYSLDIAKQMRDRVHVDPDRIHEVIANMISNAIKYTDEGSVTVRLTQPKDDVVRFEGEDTGTGISKEEQVKLFQKFYRVETNVGKTTGTGLGLYISRLLVEKFDGKIGLDSELGKGSTFWFEIPLAKSTNDEKLK